MAKKKTEAEKLFAELRRACDRYDLLVDNDELPDVVAQMVRVTTIARNYVVAVSGPFPEVFKGKKVLRPEAQEARA